MPKLQVTPTGKRMAFDIVDNCPDYAIRHSAKAVFVHCDDVVREARLRTYTNDSVPFGPTIRHYRNISDGIIHHFHFKEGQVLDATLRVDEDGSHHYIIQR